MIRTITEYISDEIPGLVFTSEQEQKEFDKEFLKIINNKDANDIFFQCCHYPSYSALLRAFDSNDVMDSYLDNQTFSNLLQFAELASYYEDDNGRTNSDPIIITLKALLFKYLQINYSNYDIVIDGYQINLIKKKEK